MNHSNHTPGDEMVSVEACGSTARDCPNVLMSTSDLKKAVEDLVREKNFSSRLRARLQGNRSLAHHRLRISVSGCPNGCSRPQIADIGLVSFVTPTVDPECCTRCGACEAACPDAAITVNDAPPEFDRVACQGCVRCKTACPVACITLSPPGVRVLLGGKLGRHPRFAEEFARETDISVVTTLLGNLIDRYIAEANPEERFSDFLRRTAKE